MASITGDSNKKTYYSVGWTAGWTAHGSRSGLFRQVSMSGVVLRVMDECVHQVALERAGKKLRELTHASGRKEPSL
jgi:hypothetical protein